MTSGGGGAAAGERARGQAKRAAEISQSFSAVLPGRRKDQRPLSTCQELPPKPSPERREAGTVTEDLFRPTERGYAERGAGDIGAEAAVASLHTVEEIRS